MTPEQRAAAERLADELQRFDGAERESLRDEAAALLRELLAEPQSEPGAAYKQGYEDALNDCIRNGLEWARGMFANDAEHIKTAEPQGEPVAWMHDGFVSTNFERVKHDESRNRASGFKAKPIIPLYAAPQQRKPLTKVQITELAEQCGYDGAVPTVRLAFQGFKLDDFARAVERAHGIVEAP